VNFVTRQQWGARPPKSRVALQPARTVSFFLHHAAGTYPNGAEAMRRIQRQHQDANGWADYAYNFGVWDDGTIFEGRGWGAQGGHTRGHNSSGVAVCYMGDGRRPVPQAALNAILVVADDADRHFGKELNRLAHRDVGATACPGDWLYGWWEANKARPVAAPPPVAEPPKPDPFALKPKWVRREDWQNLIDWRKRQRS
jgi:hypothetical protein